MSKKTIVPNQRESVILAFLLYGEAYGREIRSSFERRTGQAMPLGSLYTTLDRMEEKGFVRSRVGEANPERGGNRRKYYKITATGTTALNNVLEWTGAVQGVPTHG
jgi:PadR family transcriptional regulator PadR